MYDLPEIRHATEAWWHGIATWLRRLGLKDVPEQLIVPNERYAHWVRPDLIFSQTCGYPLTHELLGRVALVATPCYQAPGCVGATYRSVILTRTDSGVASLSDLAGKTAAVNGFDSQSGWNVLRHSLREFGDARRFLGDIVLTGAHRNSVAALNEGRADVAAIDCVSYELLRIHAPREVEGLSVLACSASAPSLPYITHRDIDERSLGLLREGLQAAVNDGSLAWARDQLLLDGFSILPIDAYNVILEQEITSKREAET